MSETITILGATGSIGESTLDVVARHPERFQLHALVAQQRVEPLLKQVRRFAPKFAVLTDELAAKELRDKVRAESLPTQVLAGPEAACDVVRESDSTMAAIVGAAGLAPTIAAARAGKRIYLANKESLVMAGRLFVQACQQFGALVLPIDSEHNAIFECLPAKTERSTALVPASLEGVQHLILTASGGPFRDWSLEQMKDITPEQAVAHPNWSMGRKISVDSATLMNKGLELIEACWLFGVDAPKVQVVIHPQSIIHSMVQYVDGSLLAQMGQPDMRTPIAHCMAWPERMSSGVAPLDLLKIGRLDFQAPDEERFLCLKLARQAWSSGAAASCVLNAANEIAVQAFLDRKIPFLRIASINQQVMDELSFLPIPNAIEDVLEVDARARSAAKQAVLAQSTSILG